MMKKKLKVGLIFGGKSGEHEVSLQSAKSVYEALDKNKYEVLLIGIDKSGAWRLGMPAHYLLNASNPKLIKLNTEAPAITAITVAGGTELLGVEKGERISGVDVFFPVTHGTFGEDGCLQGFLELLGAAYVGPGVLGSAVGMDKDVMKRLCRGAGIPVGKFLVATRNEISPAFMQNAIDTLKLPIFVKPANLGSSVGISKAPDKKGLEKAIELAFRYDTKIILEEYVRGREIECAVLGNANPMASLPGEVRSSHEFYSYEAKYIDEHGAALEIPAKLSPEQISQAQKLAIKVFQILECSGMARVDFFLKPDGEWIVNEINTLPGFTKISMYPKLWEATGIPYSELLDRLIQLAIEKKQEKDGLQRTFNL